MPYNALCELASAYPFELLSLYFLPCPLSLATLEPLLLPQQEKLMTIPPLLPLSFSLRLSHDLLSFIQICPQMTPLRKSLSKHTKRTLFPPLLPTTNFYPLILLHSFYNTYQNLASVCVTLILYLFFQNVTLLFVTLSFSIFLSRMLHSKERKQTCLSGSL